MKNQLVQGIVVLIVLLYGPTNAFAQHAMIDCSTASDDISTLQGEKEKVQEHKSRSLFSITPIGMVVGALSDEEKKTKSDSMHVDEYNEKIDAHIAKIKAACPGAE